MRKSLTIAALVVAASTSLVGCASGGTTASWIVSDLDMGPDAAYVEGLIESCRAKPSKECRNTVLDAAKGHHDAAYYTAKTAFLGDGGGSDSDRWWSSIPVLNLVFATASSRESSADKVADMSAATALLNGLQSIFRRPDDKDKILDDRGVLVAQMEDDRREIANVVKLKSMRGIEDYTLEEALSDMGRYRLAGTPTEARMRLANLLGI